MDSEVKNPEVVENNQTCSAECEHYDKLDDDKSEENTPIELETVVSETLVSETVVSENVVLEADQKLEQDIEDENPEIDADAVQEMSDELKMGMVEALIFTNGEPLSISKLEDASKLEAGELTTLLAAIEEKHKSETSGFELVCVAEQYQFRTKARYSPFVRALKASAPKRLSNPALETVSIIAYRQPIVKSDIERIRGVDATPTLKTLIERDLVKIVGHQPSVGQPALYGTTDGFLKLFGLKSLSDLPTLRDLEELQRDPGETESEEGEVSGSQPEAELPQVAGTNIAGAKANSRRSRAAAARESAPA